MKCPFCGEEMEHGYLYASQRVGFPWFPDGQKLVKYIPEFNTKKKGGMVFGKEFPEAFEYDTLSLFVCRKCKKGVADSLTEKDSGQLLG